MELRAEFAAFAVDGDGNCFWRSAAHGLWGTDYFWPHLKLVTLAKAAATAEQLVGETRHLHHSCVYYRDDVLAKFQVHHEGRIDPKQDNYEHMLLAEVLRMCPSGRWGSGLSAHLVSEALGIRVKVIDPTDMRARKGLEATNTLANI